MRITKLFFIISAVATLAGNASAEETLLHQAARDNNAALAKRLIAINAEWVNEKGKQWRTPLHWAARFNAVEVAKVLIDNGADVTVRDNGGLSPLDVARGYDSLEVVELLAEPAPKGTEAKGKCGEMLIKIDEAIREAAGISQEATPIAGLRHNILKLALTQAQSAMGAAKRHCN